MLAVTALARCADFVSAPGARLEEWGVAGEGGGGVALRASKAAPLRPRLEAACLGHEARRLVSAARGWVGL